MAQISIRGIRLKTLTVNPDPKSDEGLVSCTYQLISSADKVLAEQSVGVHYGGIKIAPSPTTVAALDAFLKAYRNDVQLTLGLDAE